MASVKLIMTELKQQVPEKVERKSDWMKSLKDNIFGIFIKPPYEKSKEEESKQE